MRTMALHGRASAGAVIECIVDGISVYAGVVPETSDDILREINIQPQNKNYIDVKIKCCGGEFGLRPDRITTNFVQDIRPYLSDEVAREIYQSSKDINAVPPVRVPYFYYKPITGRAMCASRYDKFNNAFNIRVNGELEDSPEGWVHSIKSGETIDLKLDVFCPRSQFYFAVAQRIDLDVDFFKDSSIMPWAKRWEK